MSMIKKDDLYKLISAAEAKSVAESAPAEIEEQSVAHAINHAANTGEKSVVYVHPISDKLSKTLKDKGYIIIPNEFNTNIEIRWR